MVGLRVVLSEDSDLVVLSVLEGKNRKASNGFRRFTETEMPISLG